MNLNFHLYNIQFVQELQERDLISRCTNFCREFLTRGAEDEAHFHLSGFVNK
jgi:hypothetical protein